MPLTQGADFHSARSAALGGAGHAAPMLSDAIYLNPAFGSLGKIHSLSFNYQMYQGPSQPKDHLANLSVLDGSDDQLFQAGVGFTRKSKYNILNIGASKAVVQRYGFGMGGKFLFPTDGSGKKFSDINLSFVSDWGSSWVTTALILDNLLESAKQYGLRRELILGIKINMMDILALYIDPHWYPSAGGLSSNQLGYEMGAELPLMQDLLMRAGMYQNAFIPFLSTQGRGFGAGIGWMAPKLALEYSYSKVIEPIDTHAHQVGISIYF